MAANALILRPEANPEVLAALREYHLHVQAGDWLVEKDGGRFFKIAGFVVEEHRKPPHRVMVSLHDRYRCKEEEADGHFSDGTPWRWAGYGTVEPHRLVREFVPLGTLGATPEEALATPIEELHALITRELADADPAASTDTALTVSGGQARTIALAEALRAKEGRVLAAQALIQRKVAAAMQGMAALQKQVAYLNKVIEVGSLYLGLGEEVTVLREGPHAAATTPLVIMQRLRYMDEEVGIEAGYREDKYASIRWDNLEQFDEWVLRPGNLDRLIPFERGLLGLRATRRQSNRQDTWGRTQENALNRVVYLLVKNGDAAYRVAPALGIGNRLYPKLGEFAALEERVAAGRKGRLDTDTAESLIFDYKKVMALVQGMIDRAPLLGPFPHEINIFDPDTYQGLLDFNRDAELALTTGRPPFRQWQQAGNARIVKGSRVFLGPYDYGRWGEYSGYGNRFAFYAHKDRYPGPPDPGVYPVEERLEPADEKFATQWVARIFYNPGGLVYSGWGDYMGHERTRRVGFRLATDDQNLLHYDELTVGELEAYINDPTEREQYLEMLPTLFAVRKHLVAERTHEATFAGQLALREKLPVGEVLEALRWWKDRVSIKRSLRDDDAKAWRMIIRKVRNKAWEGE